MKFLEEENFLSTMLSRFVDLILINIMWLICCIPIITIGASTTAMYDQCLKMAYKEEPSVLSGFFISFKKNLKRGTGLFLITFLVGAFLVIDFWCATKMDLAVKFILEVMILSVGYFYLCVTSHVWGVQAYFNEPIMKTIKHAFVLSMRNGIYTVFVVILDLIPVLVFFFSQNLFWKYLFLFLTFIFAMIAYMNSLHMSKLFDPKRFEEIEAEAKERARERAKEKENASKGNSHM